MNDATEQLQPQSLLEPVCGIAQRAGDEILRIYDSDFAVEQKQDRSPLTAADLASHHCILDGLAALSPRLPVLSEESKSVAFEERRNWQRYWLVDPLDGTREFINRNGEFTVNIALVCDHEVELGVVHVPVNGTTYFAARGAGAFRRRAGGASEPIRTRRFDPAHPAAAGSRSHLSEAERKLFAALGEDAQITSAGSSLKFCLVAEGAVDIYPRFGPTSEWDTAAAQGIVEQAGGAVLDLAFSPLGYNRRETLLNPAFLVLADPAYDWAAFLEPLAIEVPAPA